MNLRTILLMGLNIEIIIKCDGVYETYLINESNKYDIPECLLKREVKSIRLESYDRHSIKQAINVGSKYLYIELV